MRSTNDLTLTDNAFHNLWSAIHKSRSTSHSITLPKQDVTNLLLDHSRMVNALFPAEPCIQKKEP